MRALIVAALVLGTAQVFAQNEPETLTLNFNDADVVEVIRFVGEKTGKTIIVDPRVKGQVQVFTNGEVTRDEAYDLLLSILDIHGFTAYESNGVVRVVPNKDVRSSPIPVTKTNGNAGDEYVTEVIPLSNVSAAKVLPVLRPLVAQHAHMAAYDPSNSIVISDSASNIARVKQVIAQIDGAAVDHTEVIRLQHAPVADAVQMLEQLIGSDGGKGSGALKMVADARTNAILVSGDELQRSRIRGLVERLDRPQAQTGNVRVIYLEYADATEVAQVLAKLVQNMEKSGDKNNPGSAAASIEADEATNALLITAKGDTLDSLLQVVERLDIRRAQVLVEAIIAEVTDTDGKELGIEWLFADQDGGFGANNNGTVGAAASSIFADDSDVLSDLATDLSSITGTILGIADFDDDKGFVGLVTALQSTDNANILSTPSILTMDNHEAEILVGQEIPVATGSFANTDGSIGSAFNTFERQPVGVSLRVTPSINEGDRIILDIEQEVSSISGQNNNGEFITNERSLTTQVLANDGQVVILGGLMRDDVQTSLTKVPVLGSIPLLGRLFRSTDDSVTKTNLMVFIRASVIRDDETLTGTTAEKYRYLREQQLDRRNAKGITINRNLLPVVPEWPISKSDDLSGYTDYLRKIDAERGNDSKKFKNRVKDEIRAIEDDAEEAADDVDAEFEARVEPVSSGLEHSSVIELSDASSTADSAQ